jgi:hypothetical protein
LNGGICREIADIQDAMAATGVRPADDLNGTIARVLAARQQKAPSTKG